MTRSDETRVRDIVEAADQIVAIAAAGETAYRQDPLRKLAIERLLEIVGEAARAMSSEGQARYAEVPWADVVGLRTLLAHHYHRIDPDQVWTVATESIPALLASLRSAEA